MAVLSTINWLKDQAIEALFPSLCAGCGKEGGFFCRNCTRRLPYLKGPVCGACGRPLATAGVCPECRRVPPAIASVKAPFEFEGAIRSAVHQLKYKDIRALAPPLAGFLYAYIRENGIQADVLVPVPLYKSRLKERGYNQSELLAARLGKLTGWSVVTDALERVRDSAPQARAASASERRRNVEGAFSCRSQALQGRAVLLVDDVCTTGATLNACAQALKQIPVSSVAAIAVARDCKNFPVER